MAIQNGRMMGVTRRGVGKLAHLQVWETACETAKGQKKKGLDSS